MLSNEEKLLTEVKGIVDKYKKIDEVTGQNFNIFNVLEVNDKEVLICRFIYQLINPKGLHNQNTIFLKKFIKNVLKIELIDDELKYVNVYKEYVIENLRRIDLYIVTNERSIPIEVKVYVGDQEAQCDDYLKYVKNSKLYYLTLFGDPPSNYSYDYKCKNFDFKNYEEEKETKLRELEKYNRIQCISFKEDIIEWIEDCLKDILIMEKPLIVDNMLQFLNNIKELCGMGDDKVNKEVNDLFEKDENYFVAYLAMKKCEDGIKIRVLSEIIDGVASGVESVIKKKYPNENIEFDEIYNNNRDKEIEKFCTGGNIGDNLPGFAIKCKEKFRDMELCAGIEVIKNSPGLYYGLYIKDPKDRKLEISKEINEKLKCGGYCDRNWVFRDEIKRLLTGSPDFRNPNEAFAELIDEDKKNDFINTIVEEIKKLYSLVNEKISI